jgi:DNA polymerase V
MREENFRRLSKKRLAVYEKVKSYIEMTGVSPTLEELRQMLSVQSLNSVLQYLDILERWGLITRHRYRQRSIELVTPEQVKRGPVVLPVIASAGCDAMTVFAQQSYDDYLTVDRSYLPTRRDFDTFVVFRAIGDSMNGAGIASGDYVLVERTDNVGSGDRVVAVIGEAAVIKRLRRTARALILEPDSTDPRYKRIIMQDDSRIFGKVLNVIKTEAEEDEYVIEYAGGRREVF